MSDNAYGPKTVETKSPREVVAVKQGSRQAEKEVFSFFLGNVEICLQSVYMTLISYYLDVVVL